MNHMQQVSLIPRGRRKKNYPPTLPTRDSVINTDSRAWSTISQIHSSFSQDYIRCLFLQALFLFTLSLFVPRVYTPNLDVFFKKWFYLIEIWKAQTTLNFDACVFTLRVRTNYLRQIMVLSDSYFLFWNKCWRLNYTGVGVCLTKLHWEMFAVQTFPGAFWWYRGAFPLCGMPLYGLAGCFYHICSVIYQRQGKHWGLDSFQLKNH